MKKVLILFGLFLCFSYWGTNEARASFGNTETYGEALSEEDILFLIENVGLTEEEIESISNKDFLRELISVDAEKSFYINEEVTIPGENIPKDKDGVSPLINGALDGSVNIIGSAYRVNNSTSGYNYTYILHGEWKWTKNMLSAFTDAFTISMASDPDIILPKNSSGEVTNHTTYYRAAGEIKMSKIKPDMFEPGSGVGVRFDIRQGIGTGNSGSTTQYIYSNKSLANRDVKFEYGHTTAAIIPGFSVGSGGISISFSPSFGGSTGFIAKSITN